MTPAYELTHMDRHFARFICRESGGDLPLLELVASLASNAVTTGNICLDLSLIAGRTIAVDGRECPVPPLGELAACLATQAAVGPPGVYRPLVLHPGGRLYLYRYWNYEQELARVILEKGAVSHPVDEACLQGGVERLFPGEGDEWQKRAAMTAVRKGFCVITGGPGTGKTSTVVKIIALLREQAHGSRLRIALAAPTGKAAARLTESIRLMKEKLDCSPEVREQIPDGVSTIHRLLGSIGGSNRAAYSRDNPLPCDVLVIDEASMVALPLMARLAVALGGDARLILLGDRDQLASVEAGAVLGDICGAAGVDSAVTSPVAGSLVVLKRNYRFDADSGIGGAGRMVNAGEGRKTLALLREEPQGSVAWRDVTSPDLLKRELAQTILQGYAPYLQAASPAGALQAFEAFRILCALRKGPYGVGAVNAMVEEILATKRLIDPHSRWYHGRPVMVTVNDYNLKLFNGDVGIVFSPPGSADPPRVYFPAADGGLRAIAPVRLPAHETVYAMTVHKSQGSEFERVLFLLPSHDSELLTRELIYTGITRAKRGVEIRGAEEIFVTAVGRRTERRSGLREALWPLAE